MPRPNPSLTRFLVTGLPRSGTNLLLHTLATHPAVVAYNELFNTHRILWGSTPVDAELGEAYLELRNTRPLAFLESVLNPVLPGVQAVGFKLFYMQGGAEESEHFRLIWPYLRRMEGLKVVDVVRKNHLAQAISWIKARRTQVWHQDIRATTIPQQAMTIPVEELQGYFLWFDTMHATRAGLLAGMDATVVHYEELTRDFPAHMARIQRHIGVAALNLQPTIRKQRTIPLTQAISNYGELREAFAATPYGRYFAMAEAQAA